MELDAAEMDVRVCLRHVPPRVLPPDLLSRLMVFLNEMHLWHVLVLPFSFLVTDAPPL